MIFESTLEGSPLSLKENINRSNTTPTKIIKIFLASSNELIAEREKIEQALGRKNKPLREKGFFIELLIWEDGKYIGNSFRSQDNYNLEIAQCDYFVMLFYSKVGKYSLEEFKKAKSLFDLHEKPRIRIYQKDVDLPKDTRKADSDSRYAFLDLLNSLDHFPEQFINTYQLVNDIEDSIDKLLKDGLLNKEVN